MNKETDEKFQDSFVIKDNGIYDNHDNETLDIDSDAYASNTITGLKSNLTSSVRSEALKVLAKNRGLRLRVIRQITNKSLEAFSKMVGIESGSLGRIERGATCLSILRAKFITDRLINHNLLVSPIWLLSGKGIAIKKIEFGTTNISQCLEKTLKGDNNHELGNVSVEFIAISAFFKQIYKDHKPITLFMNDNYMEPVYKKGDLLGALEIEKSKYKTLYKTPCIVNFTNNNILVRYVFFESPETLLLSTYNDGKPEIVKLHEIKSISKICLCQATSIDAHYLTSKDEDVSSQFQGGNVNFIKMNS